MQTVLLDGSGYRTRNRKISERSRRFTGANFERRASRLNSRGSAWRGRMKFSAVLLAGGESRRFGCDKATVSFRGEPMWQRQMEILRGLTPLELFVSARTDRWWRPSDVTFIPDELPSHGPLSGLAAAMGSMRGTHLLALAVDMPLMTSSYLQFLCGLASCGKGVLPRIGGRAEPVAAIYPRESFAQISAALKGGELSVQSVAAKLVGAGILSVVEVDVAHQEFYRNINEPVDLASASAAAAAYVSQTESNFFVGKTFNK
jgi:molybdenum cofactor guanylyltransferase